MINRFSALFLLLREFWFTILAVYGMLFSILLFINLVREILLWGIGSLLKHYFWVNFVSQSFPVYSVVFFGVVFGLCWLKQRKRSKLAFLQFS